MKVLLDENMPHPLRYYLPGHDVVTTAHQGWLSIRNGNLLGRAEQAGFTVLVTADQSMSFQQNMKGRSLGLVVLNTPDWPRIQSGVDIIAEGILRCTPGSVIYIEV